MKKSILLIVSIIIFTKAVEAQVRIEPLNYSRIFWDISTKTTIFSPGNYARMIQLQDGRLMAVAQFPNGIGITYSIDLGVTWTNPKNIAPSPTGITNSVPDIFQLKDRTILVCYNPRPNTPYSSERHFGIRLRRSTDNGLNWSNEIFIYDASYTNTEGCWEPAFLELPSGEAQVYFANENDYSQSNDQNISMCRSFDKGLTWSSRNIVSYRSGHRDGMPSPLLLQDSSIVVAIEDNGYVGHSPKFQPSIIRTSIDDNWSSGFVSGSNSNRNLAFPTLLPDGVNAAAPYIRQLPWGETILSYQGSENRPVGDNYQEMFVTVGTSDGKNFQSKTNPFALPLINQGLWNSISVIDTGIVVALTSTNLNNTSNDIMMMKGYPKRMVNANRGDILIDGVRSANEKWTTYKAEQLIMGYKAGTRSGIDFLYNDKYLFFTAKVFDTTTMKDSVLDDGIRLLLDVDDVSTSSPQAGTYNIFFDINGTSKILKGENGNWVNVTDNSIISSVTVSDKRYYLIEAAIPWVMLGKNVPPVGQRMGLSVEVLNSYSSGYITETVPDAIKSAPYTWLSFYLSDTNQTGFEITKANYIPVVKLKNNIINVESGTIIKNYQLISFSGQTLKCVKTDCYSLKIPFTKKTGILVLENENGETFTQKIINI
ncbi:MAG: exo-alpha-sialidase [Paludibacter sp.]|nr:exo-alpha-sialidase [Paludibacter sp.]